MDERRRVESDEGGWHGPASGADRQLCDTVRAIFETHGARFLPAFVHLMPLLGRMLVRPRSTRGPF